MASCFLAQTTHFSIHHTTSIQAFNTDLSSFQAECLSAKQKQRDVSYYTQHGISQEFIDGTVELRGGEEQNNN